MTASPSRPRILLGLVCPPLYLKRCRSWIGAVLVGLLWVPGAALAALGFLMTFTKEGWGPLLLFPGLVLILLSAFTAWLWAWWAPAGVVVWGSLLLILAKYMLTPIHGP